MFFVVGLCITKYRKNVIIIKWNDKKNVFLLSTIHNDVMGIINKRASCNISTTSSYYL